MLSWRVVTILLLFSSLGNLVPVPGKHFLIETEDEAVDEPDVEFIGKKMENRLAKSENVPPTLVLHPKLPL